MYGNTHMSRHKFTVILLIFVNLSWHHLHITPQSTYWVESFLAFWGHIWYIEYLRNIDDIGSWIFEGRNILVFVHKTPSLIDRNIIWILFSKNSTKIFQIVYIDLLHLAKINLKLDNFFIITLKIELWNLIGRNFYFFYFYICHVQTSNRHLTYQYIKDYIYLAPKEGQRWTLPSYNKINIWYQKSILLKQSLIINY